MSAARILLVDDEPSLTGVLAPVLTAEGYDVTIAATGEKGLRLAREEAPDLMLLDLGLPDLDGKEIIRSLRAESSLPIIVISARHQQGEKVQALDEGADDYVDKPFDIEELLARIRAAHRRHMGPKLQQGFASGPLAIDFATRKVLLFGEPVRLSPKEYDLLRTLALHAGQVVTHKRLLAAGWGDKASDAQYLRVYVGLLRQKIEEDSSDPKLLLTEPGVGYRLAC